jgi:hypothetical protein
MITLCKENMDDCGRLPTISEVKCEPGLKSFIGLPKLPVLMVSVFKVL